MLGKPQEEQNNPVFPDVNTHPRWPLMTRYSFQGACHTGRGHLLGIRRATAADGRYSSCPPPACMP